MAHEVVRLESIKVETPWAIKSVAAVYQVTEKTVNNALDEFRAEAEENLETYISMLKTRHLLD